MVPPVATGLGATVSVTERSGVAPTVVVAVATDAPGLAVTVSVITVPAGAPVAMVTVIVIVVVLPLLYRVDPLESVHVTVPPASTHAQFALARPATTAPT